MPVVDVPFLVLVICAFGYDNMEKNGGSELGNLISCCLCEVILVLKDVFFLWRHQNSVLLLDCVYNCLIRGYESMISLSPIFYMICSFGDKVPCATLKKCRQLSYPWL